MEGVGLLLFLLHLLHLLLLLLLLLSTSTTYIMGHIATAIAAVFIQHVVC